MRYWVGIVFFAAGAALFVAAVLHKRRVLAARAAAAARGIVPGEPGLRSVAAFREIMRPIILAFLVYAAIKTVVLFVMLDGEDVLSYFDVAGVLFMLAGYGAWMSLRTTYRTSDLVAAEAAAAEAAAAAGIAAAPAGAGAMPAYMGLPANDRGPPQPATDGPVPGPVPTNRAG
ncbi:hypothetical protein RHODGE_RHODGE_02082 [Rhodoplanes serenus]|uniref:Uncharacterized protein n=1 Tax=Rhodoplanes serenus TaxID=200615 RepID=A0A447CSJ8_9BRAD|nr:hypothetical protein [Rhodoplanes serenus]VCU08223.1 hypothetical protein RHODGE_RHODGE_02082 [Rhodoplanes serenus]